MFWTIALLAALGQAEKVERADPANQVSLERMVDDLSQFELSVVDPPETLTLHPAPLLRWSYPIRNVDDAALFVWLGKERPESIVTVMSYRGSGQRLRRAYEFLSLSEYRLSANRNGQRWWHPEQPGFAWRPLLGFASHRMPLDGLYLCGAGAHPGGGVTGLPGRAAARAVLADAHSRGGRRSH